MWELRLWISNGWLVLYSGEKLGPPKGLIPLMAMLQQHKSKVRPVMDFQELNHHVDSFTANADICATKLREWQQKGSNVSLLDLKRAYLQVCVHESLWPFQTMKIDGRRYCLICLGFGLNVAPLIMKAIISTVLAQDATVSQVASVYIDDTLINEDVTPTTSVREHLAQFELECKDPERLENGIRVLRLAVAKERGKLQWRRGSMVPNVPASSHDGQYSLYVEGLSGTFRCVAGSACLVGYLRGEQDWSRRAGTIRLGMPSSSTWCLCREMIQLMVIGA